ncbi:MAG: metal-dependent hydrolase [Azoarcus sp.]|jgi:hypothetical protein|nr:metal-dependent hydrolase [Azoarcus sp.]
MSPVTHFLAGWAGFEGWLHNRRDRAIVCLTGLAPDIDGIGIAADLFSRLNGGPETNYYQAWHRLYGHGITAALVFTLCAALLGRERARVAIAAFLNIHLHLLCDLLGSRGGDPDDLWGIHYLGPWNTGAEIVWRGQWELVSWQNMLISIALMGIVLARACRKGYSPLGLVSPRADRVFIGVLRKWRSAW